MISAIARYLGRDRNTIRGYLTGKRTAGVRAPAAARTGSRVRRLLHGPPRRGPAPVGQHPVRRVAQLGYGQSDPNLTRQLRDRGLRPACEPCRPAKGRQVSVIDHPGGEETQWDWVELPDPAAARGWGKNAHLLVGAASQLLALARPVVRGRDRPAAGRRAGSGHPSPGRVTRVWRFERMGTVRSPNTGPITSTVPPPRTAPRGRPGTGPTRSRSVRPHRPPLPGRGARSASRGSPRAVRRAAPGIFYRGVVDTAGHYRPGAQFTG